MQEQRVYRRLMISELTFESRWSVYRIDLRTLDPANSMAEIYTNLDRIHENANVGDFLLARLIRRTNLLVSLRACGRTRISPFSTLPDRIVPFAPPSGTATLPAFATRSPISLSRSTLFRAAFPPSRTSSFLHSATLFIRSPSSSFEYL